MLQLITGSDIWPVYILAHLIQGSVQSVLTLSLSSANENLENLNQAQINILNELHVMLRRIWLSYNDNVL
jgi:hypothetical protein